MEEPNLIKVLEKSIIENWNLAALSDYKVSTNTYGDIGERVLKLHALFQNCGVSKGDKIALIGKNSTQWAITYLATITYGATIVPILADFHKDNIHNIVNHSDSILLFIDDNIFQKLEPASFNNLKAVLKLSDNCVLHEYNSLDIQNSCNSIESYFNEKYPDGFTKEQFCFPEVKNSNLGVISYTSGTTGFSKGVMLPLTSLMANMQFAWNNMPLEAEDELLSILPLAHAYGCAFEFLFPFTLGVHITFLGKTVSPQIMIEAFQAIKPRLLLMVPLILEKIYKKKLLPVLSTTSMRILLSIPVINKLIYSKIKKKLSLVFGDNFREVVIGGAALNKEVELFLRRIGFNFSVGYGMTECGPLVSYANWDKTELGSCGKIVDTLEITIDSPDPELIPGEILVKGSNVMTGYYKNPDETKKIIDTDGWLHTGDLGVIDKNKFIHIRGRSKCMILGPSGENIYPEEIESKLNNYPYILEQIVISDDNKLVALVFPDFDKAKSEGVKDEQLSVVMDITKKQINKTLPKYSQISDIRIQEEEFEKTPKQSIKRFIYEQKVALDTDNIN